MKLTLTVTIATLISLTACASSQKTSGLNVKQELSKSDVPPTCEYSVEFPDGSTLTGKVDKVRIDLPLQRSSYSCSILIPTQAPEMRHILCTHGNTADQWVTTAVSINNPKLRLANLAVSDGADVASRREHRIFIECFSN